MPLAVRLARRRAAAFGRRACAARLRRTHACVWPAAVCLLLRVRVAALQAEGAARGIDCPGNRLAGIVAAAAARRGACHVALTPLRMQPPTVLLREAAAEASAAAAAVCAGGHSLAGCRGAACGGAAAALWRALLQSPGLRPQRHAGWVYALSAAGVQIPCVGTVSGRTPPCTA